MEENYLIEDSEFNNNETNEEDPILVAQRYLNIFHQIHIFNSERKNEFDQSLLSMPEKIKQLIITLPGGRVLLEHVQELEENQGISSKGTLALIAQNKASRGNKDATPAISGGVIAGGELTLGENFAQDLAHSLASAFKDTNVLQSANANGISGGGNLNAISEMFNKSIQTYTSNMQNLTESILEKSIRHIGSIQQNGQSSSSFSNSASSIQRTVTTPLQEKESSIPTQQNTQHNTQNSNSTTINNISMDSAFFNSLQQTIQKNDERRHSEISELIEALNNNLALHSIITNKEDYNGAPIVVPEFSSKSSATVLAQSVSNALQASNKQQIEAIKAFGEILVQAITQSQRELAETILQSSSSDSVKSEKNNNKVNTLDTNKNKSSTDDKKEISFAKSFSEKISKTTKELAQNMSNFAPININPEKAEKAKIEKAPIEKAPIEKAPIEQSAENIDSSSFLNKLNKGLNKLGDLKDELKKHKDNKLDTPKANTTNIASSNTANKVTSKNTANVANSNTANKVEPKNTANVASSNTANKVASKNTANVASSNTANKVESKNTANISTARNADKNKQVQNQTKNSDKNKSANNSLKEETKQPVKNENKALNNNNKKDSPVAKNKNNDTQPNKPIAKENASSKKAVTDIESILADIPEENDDFKLLNNLDDISFDKTNDSQNKQSVFDVFAIEDLEKKKTDSKNSLKPLTNEKNPKEKDTSVLHKNESSLVATNIRNKNSVNNVNTSKNLNSNSAISAPKQENVPNTSTLTAENPFGAPLSSKNSKLPKISEAPKVAKDQHNADLLSENPFGDKTDSSTLNIADISITPKAVDNPENIDLDSENPFGGQSDSLDINDIILSPQTLDGMNITDLTAENPFGNTSGSSTNIADISIAPKVADNPDKLDLGSENPFGGQQNSSSLNINDITLTPQNNTSTNINATTANKPIVGDLNKQENNNDSLKITPEMFNTPAPKKTEMPKPEPIKPLVQEVATEMPKPEPIKPQIQEVAAKIETKAQATKNTATTHKSATNATYEDALQKIKDALNPENKDVPLSSLDVEPINLSGKAPESDTNTETMSDEDILLDDSNFDNFFNKNINNNNINATNNDEDWEYVDDNGNPVDSDDDGEWEYVDEDGNPIDADADGEWEYVDENGNPIDSDDDGEWEYVDENGNPIDSDDDGEWEYVDENGNPLPQK